MTVRTAATRTQMTGNDTILPGREALWRMRERDLVLGTPSKADVWTTLLPDGSRAVVKDFRHKPWAARVWGRIQVRREARALAALAGLPAVPRLLGRVDRDALVVEYVPGKALFLCVRRPSRLRYLAELREAIDAAHARGVVHNDLRGRENAHVTSDTDRVVILDWAAAIHLPPGSWRHRVLFRWLKNVDESAYLKWKLMLAPESLSQQEQRFLKRFRVWRRLWPFNRKGLAGQRPPR